ncbi:hypothetical protein C8A01DRAFT_31404 [Parachaetomium inaequale]|uniref:G-protein coupled receptors family 2 profile 2 domain-containing protein n=1 Tax=Parachaetomium inaequale TaxID=2588326 RepID=A0AAN6PNR7_9PEZI|nr:hypothetical protein C8A01DRAFT_31404 [Parachaetomium inaequale]
MDTLGILPRENGHMNLTDKERDTLQIIERVGASVSLVGVCLIFIAYGLFPRVRTVPNTFIFFASIANVGASIACLIGYSGILAGDPSALCQAQAFLLEMFMQSDPWWSFAMAVNVYMVFFMSYPPNNFHNHLWLYCLICFGIPALPAFICLLYAPNGKRIYGNATLWCWIDDSYNPLRIFTYYLPIWMCILLSTVIYVAVGYHVFHQRNQLRNLTLSNQARDIYDVELRDSEKEQHSYGTVTTEVQVTAESSGSQTPPSTPAGSIAPVLHKPAAVAAHAPWASPDDDGDDVEQSISPTTPAHITSSHNTTSKPFTTTSTTISSTRPREANKKRTGILTALGNTWRKLARKLATLDPIKLAYLRTSFVFAISILVTWTPSSINRVYSLVYPARTSYPLNLAGAVVLPLQGLWNAIIFAATSCRVLGEEFREMGGSGGRWLRFGFGSSRRLSGGSGDADERGKQTATGTALPTFRSRDGSIPEDRELATMAPPPRMANVRVIRGGSL